MEFLRANFLLWQLCAFNIVSFGYYYYLLFLFDDAVSSYYYLGNIAPNSTYSINS